MKIRNGKVWGYIIKRVGVVGFFDQPERMFGGGSGEVEEEKGGEEKKGKARGGGGVRIS